MVVANQSGENALFVDNSQNYSPHFSEGNYSPRMNSSFFLIYSYTLVITLWSLLTRAVRMRFLLTTVQ